MSRGYCLSSAPVERVTDATSISEVIARKVDDQLREGVDDPFYVADLNDVVKKYERWQALLPRVTPFYAVKAQPDAAVVELLAQLGVGFDCASKNEIALVMGLGVAADRIVYANTCKQPDMIRYAAHRGVNLMTFDNADELSKIHRLVPDARLVLRILPPKAKQVSIELGGKFGCPPRDVRRLLRAARDLRLSVVGISFHVGYGCKDAAAFAAAVQAADNAFEAAEDEGFHPQLLDIGGGFPGYPGCGITMEEIARALAPALDEHFPAARGVRIIAEPGAYFVASAMHLAVQVIGRRVTAQNRLREGDEDDTDDAGAFEYYLNDGFYGSFCRGVEATRVPIPLRAGANICGGEGRISSYVAAAAASRLYPSVLYGPTCDGADVILRDVRLPELRVGDWLVFPYMGHYTTAAVSSFNGMPCASVYRVQMAEFDSTFNHRDAEIRTSAQYTAAAPSPDRDGRAGDQSSEPPTVADEAGGVAAMARAEG